MDSASLAAMGYYAAEEDKLRRERQEQSNPIDAIGKTALAAGAIAAAILGGRRLGGLKNTSSTVDLSTINPNTVRRAAGRPAVDIPETVVASRTPPPVVRTEPKSTLERLDDRNEFIRQAREERPQGITFVSKLGEEPTIVPKELILPKTIKTPTAQGFGIAFYNELLGKTSAPAQSTTSLKTVSQPRTLLDPFGSPTVPIDRSQEFSTRRPRSLSLAAPDAVDRLLNDPDLLKLVEVEQEAEELAGRKLRALETTGDEIISSLRSEANTAKAAAQGDYAQEYLKTAGYKDADTMVDLQVSNTPRNTDQTLNAIDAAEDQQTGRVYQQLQRNEDLDLNQIEIMEDMQITDEMRRVDREAGYEIDSLYSDRDQGFDIGEEDILREANKGVVFKPDAPINQVASQLPDGLPADQAEGLDLKTGRRYATYDEIPPIPPYKSSILNPVTESYGREIKRLQSQLNTEYVFNPPPEEAPRLTGTSAIRFMEAEREKISGELAAKGIAALPQDIDAELAKRLGPKASSYGPRYTARAQAMQTVANTGDPIAAETIKRFGLQPVTFETFRPSELNPVTTYLNEANRLEGKAEPTAATQYLASKVVKNIPAEQQRLFDTRPPMSLEGYPSTEIKSAIDPTGIMVNAPGYGVVDIAELRKPVIMGGTARQADDFIKGARQNKQEYIEDFTSKMEGLKQEIYGERKQLALETGKNLRLQQNQAKENGQINTVRKLEDQIQTLLKIYNNPESSSNLKGSFSSIGRHRQEGRESIDSVNNRLIGAEKENNKQIQELQKKYPTTLANRTGEASRVFGQRNVDTGEFIPETMEVRSDRSDVELGRKRGSGRNIAEYAGGSPVDYSRGNPGTPPLFRKEGEKLILVKPAGLKSNIRDYDIETGGAPDSFQDDRSGSGRVIDQYGIRLAGEKGANPTRRPSEPSYTRAEIKGEIARANEPIRYEEAVQRLGAQPATEAGRQSINASEEIRRIQRSNPPAKAQALVSSFLQQLKGV